jgi:hypothetical protein
VARVEVVMNKEAVAELVQIIQSLRRTEHDDCEDCFYSCPMHEDYCGAEDRDYCNCGLEENNAKVDRAIKLLHEVFAK